MKEIVEKILEEERRAQERIDNARKESEAAIHLARKDAAGLLKKSADDSLVLAEKMRSDAEKESDIRKEAVLKKVKDEVSAAVRGRERSIVASAARIFDEVIQIKE